MWMWSTRAILTLAVLLLAAEAQAQRVTHRVRFGETLDTIALHYYGSTAHGGILQTHNGRESRAVEVGDRLRIPTAYYFTTSRNTTVAQLGRKLLGDRRRGGVLQLFNTGLGKKRGKIKAQTRVLVPFVLSHAVAAGETFVDLAKRYYGDPQRAQLIAAYNGLRGNEPPASSALEIPIAHLRILPSVMQDLVNVQLLGVGAESRAEERAGLQEANAMLRRGAYLDVTLRLVRLLAAEHASDTYTAEIYKLLAIAYVAVDQPALAVRAFQEALLRQPNLALDAVTNSPKVIRAYRDAKALQRR